MRTSATLPNSPGSPPDGPSPRPRRRRVSARGLAGWLVALPPVKGSREVVDSYSGAGGSLLAEGLAYSALFAGLTGLLLFVGLLGYLVPAQADRERLLESFTGGLEPFVPYTREALSTVAAHAGEFSIVGLASLAWGTSHFYGALDTAVARVFARAPARGWVDRILRGLVSVLLLVGGLLSGIAFAAIQAAIVNRAHVGLESGLAATVSEVAFPVVTFVVVAVAVGILYRVVPNVTVPIRVLLPPALVAALVLTALTRLLVFLAPLLTGGLSVFGGVAAIFAALAWLHLAFQVLLLGAAWTKVRLDDAYGEVA